MLCRECVLCCILLDPSDHWHTSSHSITDIVSLPRLECGVHVLVLLDMLVHLAFHTSYHEGLDGVQVVHRGGWKPRLCGQHVSVTLLRACLTDQWNVELLLSFCVLGALE